MLQIIKYFAKKLPVLIIAYDFLIKRYSDYKLKSMSTEKVFTAIYKSNAWGGEDSVSGPGSDLSQTKNIIKELPLLFDDFSISSMMDIPCGDFYWMSKMDLSSLSYLGGDIVEEMIQKNNYKYSKDNLGFKKLI